MKVHTLLVGELAVNCYIIETGNQHCAAIDIGGSEEKVLAFLKEHQLKLNTILLTHGHYDHIAGVAAVQAATGAAVYIHEADADMMTDDVKNLAQWISTKPFQPILEYQVLKDGDTLVQDTSTVQVLHTPGHTPGSVCYLIEGHLFTGDTLFRLSRGRTDFPGGSDAQMYASLQRLKQLEGDFPVYPGHNESSTLEFERVYNPNLR